MLNFSFRKKPIFTPKNPVFVQYFENRFLGSIDFFVTADLLRSTANHHEVRLPDGRVIWIKDYQMERIINDYRETTAIANCPQPETGREENASQVQV